MKKLIIFFFTLVSLTAYAQSPQFEFIELLRKKEALQIHAIFPDRVGYLWVGTNQGAFRYNGIEAKQFKKSDGLSDDAVTAFAQDSLGRIWCGHSTGKISIITSDGITPFEPSEGSAAGLISDMLFDHAGTLWFSTHNDGLYYFLNDRLYRIDENEGLRDLFFYDLEEDKDGNIWAGSDDGIAICSMKGKSLSIKLLSTENGLQDNIIHKIHQDEDGTFWLGTEDSGLIHYSPSDKKFKPVNISLEPVNDFVLDGNNIWLATKASGVILLDKISSKASVFNGTVPIIDVLAKDREGNIWYGSKKGLVRSYGNHLTFLDLKDELKDNNIFAVTPDTMGNLWFSTEQGLFKYSKGENGKGLLEKPLANTPHDKLFIISLLADEQGFLWAGTYGQGLIRINIQTKSANLYNKELNNGNVLSITGKNQTIWLATLGGVSKITLQNNKLEFKNIGTQEGLSTDYIYQVFVDSRDRVWMATDGKGVDMLDEKGFHHFAGEINSKVVYGFAEDFNHTIWANVQNEGLFFLKDRDFKALHDSTGFENKDVACLASTRSGNLIVGHEYGLEIFSVEKKLHYYLGSEKEFTGRQPNLNATARDREGNIYFGTEGGIVIYNGGLKNLPSSPVPYIESLKIFDQVINDPKDLALDYDENNIRVNYGGFWFQNPEGINFKYQLENYDHEWITSVDRSVTYSNLPPGKYTFRLKVSNDELFGSTEEAMIHFVIRPPFWKTVWFYSLSGLLVIAAGYLFITYREKNLIKAKHELEERVKERTLEIMKMNHEIKHQAEEIRAINDNLEKLVHERTNELEHKNQALEEAAFINAHNLRAPVASLLGLINLIKKLDWKEQDKEYLQHLEQSANKLDEVVSTITRAIHKADERPYREDRES